MPESVKSTVIYFAYGSNMLKRRLLMPDRAPSAAYITTGYVEGRRLAFHKVGHDGSGKCDINATNNPRDRVFGVLFRMSPSDKINLDCVEGLGRGYKEQRLDVITPSGRYQATTYVATNRNQDLLPFHWYKALVIAGAVENNLPTDYIDWLRTFKSQSDSDSVRNATYEALLFGG